MYIYKFAYFYSKHYFIESYWLWYPEINLHAYFVFPFLRSINIYFRPMFLSLASTVVLPFYRVWLNRITFSLFHCNFSRRKKWMKKNTVRITVPPHPLFPLWPTMHFRPCPRFFFNNTPAHFSRHSASLPFMLCMKDFWIRNLVESFEEKPQAFHMQIVVSLSVPLKKHAIQDNGFLITVI